MIRNRHIAILVLIIGCISTSPVPKGKKKISDAYQDAYDVYEDIVEYGYKNRAPAAVGEAEPEQKKDDETREARGLEVALAAPAAPAYMNKASAAAAEPYKVQEDGAGPREARLFPSAPSAPSAPAKPYKVQETPETDARD